MVPSITIGWDIHGSFGLVIWDVHGQMVILEESMSWTFSVNGVFPCSSLKPPFHAHFLNMYTYLNRGYFSNVSPVIPGSRLARTLIQLIPRRIADILSIKKDSPPQTGQMTCILLVVPGHHGPSHGPSPVIAPQLADPVDIGCNIAPSSNSLPGLRLFPNEPIRFCLLYHTMPCRFRNMAPVARWRRLPVKSCRDPFHIDALAGIHCRCVGDVWKEVVFDLGCGELFYGPGNTVCD